MAMNRELWSLPMGGEWRDPDASAIGP
jgi:hypothetical protein